MPTKGPLVTGEWLLGRVSRLAGGGLMLNERGLRLIRRDEQVRRRVVRQTVRSQQQRG